MTSTPIAQIVALYERWGLDRYDEDISQLDHALQTAALATEAGASEELVIAALLHDIGHLLHLAGEARSGEQLDPQSARHATTDRRHEAVGARYLAPLFPPAVTAPISLHVQAKRYRCATDPDYHRALSEGSRTSLERQGGPFTEAQAAAFTRRLGASAAIELRGWDDEGKIDGLDVNPFDAYVDLLERTSKLL